MNRLRVPWSELSAIVAGFVALMTWEAHGRTGSSGSAALCSLLAVACALIPRKALSANAPVAAEAAAIAGALSAVAIATTVAGQAPTRLLGVVHSVLLGEVLTVATLVALALPMGLGSLRRAALPAVAIGLLGALGCWPTGSAQWHLAGSDLLSPVATVAVGIAFLHGLRGPKSPIDRARLIAPALGASVLALAITASKLLGASGSTVAESLGLVALTFGLTMGTGAIALERAAALSRRCLAALTGLLAGALVLWAVPSMPLVGLAAGVAVLLAALSRFEGSLRPDGGALLDACDEIERALVGKVNHLDLAAAALDPLRICARDLRAPAALWVLDRGEVLRVDVAGAASAARLSLTAERAILTWLRSRGGALFADTLRPLVVRRAELRPVLEALESHGALAALALTEEADLIGVLLVPRGRRSEVPTYEEEARLSRMARALSGALSTVSALSRAHERGRRAQAEQERAELAARAAQDELMRRDEISLALTSQRAIGTLESEWVGYSPPMRALAEAIEWHVGGGDPVALVSEVGAGAVAVAREIHRRGERRGGPFFAADASAVHPKDALATLVGDARGEGVLPGWLELAARGTLLIEELPALGHDALVALLDALRSGCARRIGAEAGYTVNVRLVVTSRKAPAELDLPAELITRLSVHALRVPALRARGEDLESLVLIGVDRACRVLGRSVIGVSPEALGAMRGYNWPGNVRELFDVLEQSVARARGARLGLTELPLQIRGLLRAASSDVSQDDADDDEVSPGDA